MTCFYGLKKGHTYMYCYVMKVGIPSDRYVWMMKD